MGIASLHPSYALRLDAAYGGLRFADPPPPELSNLQILSPGPGTVSCRNHSRQGQVKSNAEQGTSPLSVWFIAAKVPAQHVRRMLGAPATSDQHLMPRCEQVWRGSDQTSPFGAQPKQLKIGEAMKLNSTQLKQTLSQFEAEVLPEDHPALKELNGIYGDHTFLLDSSGLNVLEPAETPEEEGRSGEIVN